MITAGAGDAPPPVGRVSVDINSLLALRRDP
jgi:hypothetical protein